MATSVPPGFFEQLLEIEDATREDRPNDGRCLEASHIKEAAEAVSYVLDTNAVSAKRRGTRIEDFHAAIAAHAHAREAFLVTASVEHMVRVPGLQIEDWSQ